MYGLAQLSLCHADLAFMLEALFYPSVQSGESKADRPKTQEVTSGCSYSTCVIGYWENPLAAKNSRLGTK